MNDKRLIEKNYLFTQYTLQYIAIIANKIICILYENF